MSNREPRTTTVERDVGADGALGDLARDAGGETALRPRPRWTVVDAAAIVGLAALALALRVPQLGVRALWHDDAWVGIVARVGYGDVPTVGLTSPGFSFLVKAWFDVVGFSDLAAQLPAFVCGVAAPPLVYLVLRGRCRRTVAVIAALVIALAPEHIVFSGRLKHYTAEVVLSLLVVWCALEIIDRPACRRRWFLLIGLSVVSVLVSFILAPVALLALGGGLISAYSTGRRALLVGLVSAGVVTVVIAAVYLLHIRNMRSDSLTEFWRDNYIALDDAGTAFSSAGALLADVVRGVTHLPPLVATLVALPLMALLIVRAPLAALVTIGPLVGAIVMGVAALAPLGGGRTDLYFVGPLVVGIAMGADRALDLALPVRWAAARAATGVLIAVGVVGVGVFGYERPEYPRMETRELIERIRSEREPGDAVLVYYPARFAYGLYGESGVAVARQGSSAQYAISFVDDDVFLGYEAAAAAAYGDRVWMIAASLHRPNYQEFRSALESEHRLRPVATWTTPGAELVLFETTPVG